MFSYQDAAWRSLLPAGVVGITAVLENDCGQKFTYEIDGPDALYLGKGDLHEPAYDSSKVVQDLSLHAHGDDIPPSPGHCRYSMVRLSRQATTAIESNTISNFF